MQLWRMTVGRASSGSPPRAGISTPCRLGRIAFSPGRGDLVKKFAAAQDLSVDILIGVQLIEAAALRVSRKDRGVLATRAEEIRKLAAQDMPAAVKMASSPELTSLDDPPRRSPHGQPHTAGNWRS